MKIDMAYRYESERPMVTVADPFEAERLLDAERERSISLNVPIIAFTIFEAGAPRTAAGLEVGINHDRGYLLYSDAKVQGQRRQTWETVGDQEGPEVPYDYFEGNYSGDVPASSEISFEQIKNAVVEFMTTGQRPACVAWRNMR
ncbi:Imm1 family immunity protein [Flindersiella endophytica]